MQIREQGRQLQCIRTEYVPEKKRTFGRVVAKQDRYLSTVADEVRQQLTNEEVDELENYLSKRKEKESVDRLTDSLSHVGYSICRATEALSVDSIASGLSSADAVAIYEGMAALAKALNKAGHKRPARAKKQPAACTQTASLPLDSDS
jgi:hypothetical protein